MIIHKEICLKINGKQSGKSRSGLIKFKTHFKQLAVPFKIYVHFELVLEKIHNYDRGKNTSYTEKYQDHISCNFAYKVVCIDDKFSKPVVIYREKMKSITLSKQLLKNKEKSILIKILSCMKIMKKDFDQVINAEYVINCLLQQIKKVRDHDHVTEKYRDSAH